MTRRHFHRDLCSGVIVFRFFERSQLQIALNSEGILYRDVLSFPGQEKRA